MLPSKSRPNVSRRISNQATLGWLFYWAQFMTYKSVKHGLPRSFTRVWVMTDTGRETTGFVKSDGEWFINCPRIRATGAKVLRWKEG